MQTQLIDRRPAWGGYSWDPRKHCTKWDSQFHSRLTVAFTKSILLFVKHQKYINVKKHYFKNFARASTFNVSTFGVVNASENAEKATSNFRQYNTAKQRNTKPRSCTCMCTLLYLCRYWLARCAWRSSLRWANATYNGLPEMMRLFMSVTAFVASSGLLKQTKPNPLDRPFSVITLMQKHMHANVQTHSCCAVTVVDICAQTAMDN